MLSEKQSDLSGLIQKILRDNIDNNKLTKTLRSSLKNRVELKKINDVFNSRSSFINFRVEELYWLTKTLIENDKQLDLNIKIDLNEYFPDNKEIFEAEQYFIQDEEDKDYIVIHNVDSLEDGSFSCSGISLQDIEKYWDHGAWSYNFLSQREPELVKIGIGSGYIKKPKLYPYNVNQIKEKLLKREFMFNTITCNILKTGSESFSYDPIKRTLTISELNSGKTFVNTIDGAHRCQATSNALKVNPKLEGWFQLKIWNVNVAQAQAFIKQEQEASPVDKEHQASLEQNKFSKTVKLINTNGTEDDNVMRYKITNLPDEVVYSRESFCLFSTMLNTLKEQWADVLQMPSDNEDVADFLVSFLNRVVGIRREDFNNFKEKKSIATSNNMFVFYVALARKLFKKKDWKQLLELIMEDIDFSENNEVWKELQITSKRDSKSIRSKIYGFVDEKFEAFKEVS